MKIIDLVVIRRSVFTRPLLVLVVKEHSGQDSKMTHDPAPGGPHPGVVPSWQRGWDLQLTSTLQNKAKVKGYPLQDYVIWQR